MIAVGRKNGRSRSLARPAVAGPFALACLLWLGGCATGRNYEALLALGDIAAGTGPSRLKKIAPEPTRATVSYEAAGHTYRADLYLPGGGRVEAGIVLVPGAVPEGKDDERLVALAKTFARLRYAVLAPELSGYRELKIGPRHVREVAEAVRHLASRQEWAPEGRVGIGAFSYGAGPAIAAALEDDVRGRVRFVLAVGGYYNLRSALRFLTTGAFEENGKLRRLEASEYGKLVFIRSTMDLLAQAGDRAAFEAMIQAKLKDPTADVSALARALDPEGLAVYRLLSNSDPAQTQRLIAALPARIVETIDALTLDNKPLSKLQARLILVHGRDDRLIPYSESLALAKSVAPGQARVFLIHHILSHVDLGMSHLFSRRFWSEELPDAWRLWRAQVLVLKERDLSAAAARADAD